MHGDKDFLRDALCTIKGLMCYVLLWIYIGFDTQGVNNGM